MNQSIIKAHSGKVRKEASKILSLHEEYGVTIERLAERFNTSVSLIKEILRGAKLQRGVRL